MAIFQPVITTYCPRCKDGAAQFKVKSYNEKETIRECLDPDCDYTFTEETLVRVPESQATHFDRPI